MALIVEFLKGRVLLFPGSEAFLSRSGNFLSRSRSFALFYFTFGDNSRRRGSSFPIFSIWWVVAVATAALGEPTLEVDPDEVIDPALATGKAFMGAFLTASGVTAGFWIYINSHDFIGGRWKSKQNLFLCKGNEVTRRFKLWMSFSTFSSTQGISTNSGTMKVKVELKSRAKVAHICFQMHFLSCPGCLPAECMV